MLKPVFDFVKDSREKAGEDVTELTYPDWLKDNLEIELSKGTSVLNLAYQDTDDTIILPVLKRYHSNINRTRARTGEKASSKPLHIWINRLKNIKSKALNPCAQLRSMPSSKI